MATHVTSWWSWPALARTLFSHLRLAVRLIREPAVPRHIKSVPFLALVYLLSPIDILPDVLPALGQLDDLGLIVLALELFLRWAPPDAVAFHRQAIAARARYSPMISRGQVVDAEWRRE